MNISGDLTLSGSYNLTILNQLDLNGEITTGTGSVILSNPNPSALVHTSGFISGNFRRAINAQGVNYIFPMGDGTTSAMLQLNFASITTTGEITASTAGSLPSGFSLNSSTLLGEVFITSNTVVFSNVSGSYSLPSSWASDQRAGLYNGTSWNYSQPPGPTASFSGWNSLNSAAFVLADCVQPNPPTNDGNQAICVGQSIPDLTVSVNTGETVDWYSSASGGTPLESDALTYTPIGAGTFYAEARNTNTGCTSTSRTAVTLTINSNPNNPTSNGDKEICPNETIPALTATVNLGETVDWYSSASGGTPLESNNLTYTPTGAGTFYAEARNTTTGCTSTSRTAVTFIIHTSPDSPTSGGDKEICADDPIPSLSASVSSGETVDWYSSASGGTPLESNNLTYTPTGAGTFYAETRNITTGCTSTSRTAVSLNIKPLHTLVLDSDPLTADQEVCINQSIATISYIFGGGATGVTVNNLPPNVTYSITGNTVNITGTPSTANTFNYTITTTGNSCPAVPLTGSIKVDEESNAGTASATNTTICYNTPTTLSLTDYVGEIEWQQSSSEIGPWTPVSGGIGQNTNTFITPNLTSNTYYKAVVTNGTCAPESSNTITIQIENTPPNFVVPAPIEITFDANCNYSAIPTITGQPNTMNFTDNCGTGGLQLSSNDSIIAATNCGDTVKIYRKWTLKDENNNQTTKIQLITVVDKQAPSLQNPAAILEITIHCNQSTDPTVTGTPVFTDNCDSSPEVNYSDSAITPVPNSCENNYSFIRTWTAEDCSGNITTRTQKINVRDNTPPTASIPEMFIDMSTEHIPFAFEDLLEFQTVGNGTFNDNCTTVPFFATIFDRAYGLEAMPGYCPDSVIRVYRITDLCGNFVDVKHKITITNKGNCNPCDYNNTHTIDLYENPDSIITLRLGRDNKCCDPNMNGNVYCIAFNIRLHPDAVGLEIKVGNGAPDVKEWKLGCGPMPVSGGIVCIPGGDFNLFTFCKEGQNENNFTIRSISGVSTDENAYARIGGDCNTQLHVEGVTSPVWQSIFPGTPGAYDGFLSNVSSTDPYFTPGPDSPPFIDYKVCGYIGTSPCVTGGNDCDTIRVYVKDTIHYTFNVDPEQICGTFYPELIPTIEPASNYTIEWFSGYDKSGTSYGIRNTFTPTLPGPYSVEVIDYQNTLYPCSRRVFNFDVAQDNQPPVVVAPPDLPLECNDLGNPQVIADWLLLATATDRQEPVNVTHNYSGITQFCNNEIIVVFSATDACGNTGTDEAKIIIRDIEAPYWLDTPDALDTTLNCNDSAGLIKAQSLEPAFIDNCESNLIPVKTSGPIPTDECINGKTIINTWVVTDACGNTSDVYTQTITLIDTIPPVIDCQFDDDDVAEFDLCRNEHVSLTPPTFSDNCGTAILSWELSGATIGSSIPGGPASPTSFNVGTTIVSWIVTDACGLKDTCLQTVIITDEQDPILSCPSSFSVGADHLKAFATNVSIPQPSHDDNCDYTLNWDIVRKGVVVDQSTNITGISLLPAIYDTLFIGENIITYYLVDINNDTIHCSFSITVESIPVLDCPPSPLILNTGADSCSTSINPGRPTLLEGSQPITWVYKIYGPDGTIEKTETFVGSEQSPGPPDIGVYEFQVDSSVIIWTATNLSGADTCIQTIIVKDNQPPKFTPPDPFEFCVENLFLAFYNGSDLDIEPIPDHYLFKAGSAELNLDMSLFTDNCCLIDTHPYGIRWKIEFSTGQTAVTGSGQPSTFGSDIPLWGDGTTYQNVVHTITYWVSDCHEVETGPFVVDINIKPRPKIE